MPPPPRSVRSISGRTFRHLPLALLGRIGVLNLNPFSLRRIVRPIIDTVFPQIPEITGTGRHLVIIECSRAPRRFFKAVLQVLRCSPTFPGFSGSKASGKRTGCFVLEEVCRRSPKPLKTSEISEHCGQYRSYRRPFQTSQNFPEFQCFKTSPRTKWLTSSRKLHLRSPTNSDCNAVPRRAPR